MRFLICFLILLLSNCGIYTFSGSALPAHIKTVSIPMFVNKTPQPGIAEEMTRMITQAYVSDNRLKVTEKNANSSLNVSITGYANDPFSYDESGNVREYRVTIRASAVFRDEVKSSDIWSKDNIVCFGNYLASSETEETGKQLAMKQIANILIENTISGW